MRVDILLVEDNPDDIELAQLALRRLDRPVTVEVARDGLEALDYLLCRGAHAGRSPHASPRLVLLDLKLPKCDGLEMLSRMRAEPATRLVPVVMLTSSGLPNDVRESYARGANSFVVKPASFERFTRVMQQVVSYWLTVNQPGDGR